MSGYYLGVYGEWRGELEISLYVFVLCARFRLLCMVLGYASAMISIDFRQLLDGYA